MKLLRLPEVMERVRLGRTSIHNFVKAGKFPKPIKQVGGSFWIDTEIDAYLQALMDARTSVKSVEVVESPPIAAKTSSEP